MKSWIKRNWTLFVAITALALSITAVCLSMVRVEPIDFNNGSLLTVVFGSMGICATIMVASQVAGLRTSKREIQDMISAQSSNLREVIFRQHLIALFKMEEKSAESAIQSGYFELFVDKVCTMVFYIHESQNTIDRAVNLNLMLIDEENKSHFYTHLSDKHKDKFIKGVYTLIKYVDDPGPLLRTFRDQ